MSVSFSIPGVCAINCATGDKTQDLNADLPLHLHSVPVLKFYLDLCLFS